VREGLCICLLSSISLSNENPLHFFGEVPERRPWAYNAKTARLLSPVAPNSCFLAPVGYRLVPTRVSILSHQHAMCVTHPAKEYGKAARKHSEKLGGKIATRYKWTWKEGRALTRRLRPEDTQCNDSRHVPCKPSSVSALGRPSCSHIRAA
jgi:hypothetical protein